MKMYYFFIMTGFFMSSVFTLKAQVFLQLEEAKEIQARKYYVGDVIEIKTTEFPKIWQKIRLERFLVDEQTIITDEGIISLSAITHVKLTNKRLAIFGGSLISFGAGWFLFGTIGSFVEGRLIIAGGQWAIGGTALVVGYLFWKYASKRKLKMGKNNRLRIVDISFPTKPILGFP